MKRLSEVIKDKLGEAALAEDSQATHMLWTLQTSGKHVYAGTVPPEEVERRRRRNRLARQARRGQRQKLAGPSPKTREVRARRRAQVAVRSVWAGR